MTMNKTLYFFGRPVTGLLMIFLLVISSSTLHAVAQSTPVVSPSRIDVTLASGECATHQIDVTLGPTPLPQLDVAMVIDVTGSMSDEIAGVTRSVEKIAADIRSLVPDVAFALATLADYEGVGGDNGDYPWRLDLNFTQDEIRLRSALANIDLMGGGDEPESYIRALYETQFLGWRDASRRLVILFGDAYPVEPDPGRDSKPGTSDDLAVESVLSQLIEEDITVMAVWSTGEYLVYFQNLVELTGGQAYSLEDTAQIPAIIQKMVQSTVSLIRTMTLRPESSGRAWLSWTPTIFSIVKPEESRQFEVTVCVPEGTASGDYSFDLDATGDGARLGTAKITVHVPANTQTAFVAGLSPWWLLLPLLLLALLIFLFLRSHRRVARVVPLPNTSFTTLKKAGFSENPKPRPNSGSTITKGRRPPQ